MADLYGLTPDVVQDIGRVLADFPAIEQAILYGSRAKGNYRPGSDIDLTLKARCDNSLHLLTDVMNALDDLDLPYLFDISILAQINNANLINHINRVGVEFYPAKK
jgi:predicted nucleotidyltransferase